MNEIQLSDLVGLWRSMGNDKPIFDLNINANNGCMYTDYRTGVPRTIDVQISLVYNEDTNTVTLILGNLNLLLWIITSDGFGIRENDTVYEFSKIL